MPEGDTIFRTATVLRSALAGAEVLRFEAPRLRFEPPAPGTRVRSVEARGKHPLIAFDDGRVLHTHMQMSGSWHVYRSGQRWHRPAQGMRVLLEVPGTVAVCFDAPVVELLRERDLARHPRLSALGPDLCSPDPDLDAVLARLERLPPEVEIGVALLDQRVASGIGNVIKSETLFARRIDPFTTLGDLDADSRRGLYAAASELLRRNLSGGPRVTSPGGLAVYRQDRTPVPEMQGRDREPAPGRDGEDDVLVSLLSAAGPVARGPGAGGRTRMSRPELAARGRRFAIATPHVEATAAGLAAFDAGGNAVDAALAAATTLAVVAPHMCGVGGDLFALVREPEGRTVVVNASGAAPALVDVDAIRRDHAVMPEHGPLTVTVPGAVSGWWQLAFHWSERGFAAAFGAAIGLARDGVAVSRTLAGDLAAEAPRLLQDPGLAAVFSSGGRPLGEGDRLVQPALARTLETIAEAGPPSVYRGVIGLAIADHLSALGSAMRLEDLSAHEAELDSPLTLRYRDLDVSVPPPNSQGFVLLEALAAIERLGIDPDPLGPDAGALAEVFRVTSADRDRHNADPRHARVPVGTLLDEGHLAGLVDQVSERTGALPSPRTGDTIALVAADASGLGVALVQSLYDGFGSGILEPATGIVLHSRGSAFSLDPEHPNVLAGGKRPAHTLLPVVVHRDGRLVALAGTMGGGGQPQIDAMSLVRCFDLGMDPAAVVAAPRWLVGGMALGIQDRTLVAESRLPGTTRDVLEAAGYGIDTVGEEDGAVGHAHLLLMRDDGTLEAGSDPRADGAAAAR